MKQLFISVCCWFIASSAMAQLTIEDCQKLAEENYPLVQRYGLLDETTQYTLQNIARGWLPQVNMLAQGTYQSAVTEWPDNLLNLMQSVGGTAPEGLHRDQYKIALNVEQAIYEGGSIKAQKEVASADNLIQQKQLDVDMYAVRQRVNDLYFGMLLTDEYLEQNEIHQELLQDNIRKMESLVKNGVAIESDIDALKAELLTAKQSANNLQSQRKSLQQVLALFINKETTEVAQLVKPEATLPSVENINRPELQLFAAQKSKIDAQEKLLKTSLLPRVSFFAQGFYGYPGYNMFEDMYKHEWSLNGMVGIKAAWNISSFYNHKTDLKKLNIARQQIDNAEDTFRFNNRLLSTQQQETINRYQKLMANDDEIITLRQSVRQSVERKIQHGTADANTLVQELTRENTARQNRSTHEIEMLQAIYNLKNTVN